LFLDMIFAELLGEPLLPMWFWISAAFLLGIIIGSFLNVYIYRFHTGKSLNGRSHCLSCGAALQWYELLPLLSYLGLRGRCRSCRCVVTPRYLLVELLTGLLFVASAIVATTLIELVFLMAFATVLVVVAVYDYYHFIIPDEFTAMLMTLVVAFVGYNWWTQSITSQDVYWSVGAALAGAGFFYLLWAIFGDVKLAVPLGLWVGATGVFSFIVLSFWVGAALSIILVLVQKYCRGKQQLHLARQTLTMKSEVPFAPFMIIGAGLVYFLHINVLSLFSFI